MLKTADNYPEVENIKQDFKSLKSHAGDLTDHVKADGKEKVDRLKEQASEKIHQLKDAGREKMRHLESYVQENPVQSLIYAFLGGIAASFLLGRR